MTYKNHTRCRVCGSESLKQYLDLGMLPLSNNLAKSATDKIHDERYPLQVLLCENCGLSQLSIVIPPEDMFTNYVYRSSISKSYLRHCHDMAVELSQKHSLNMNTFHIDIAGNDGALLREFKNFLGHRILNIDPAVNLCRICAAEKIPMLNNFWGMAVARKIVDNYGQADLVTATNVFAHVDDVNQFMEAVGEVLKPNGVLVMEFPYLINFIEGRELDTVYFEHLSYFSIFPLQLLCESHGLHVMAISMQDIHGGSVRVTVGRGFADGSVKAYIKKEFEDFHKIDRYLDFEQEIKVSIAGFREFMLEHENVAGFAASAKGNTLLNCAGITDKEMRYIVDETPEKIFMYSPGTRIPIVPLTHLKIDRPEYLVILSWNFAQEIMSKCRVHGYTGKFVIPIPSIKIIG